MEKTKLENQIRNVLDGKYWTRCKHESGELLPSSA